MKATAVLVLICSSLLCAQTKAVKRVWAQEPDSFAHIKFGSPLRDSVPECPKDETSGITTYKWYAEGQGPCYAPSGDHKIVHNVPSFIDVYVTEYDGKVEDIVATFSREEGRNSDLMKRALIEKFGPAHSRTVLRMQNGVGATYNDEVLEWKGKNITLSFDPMSEDITTGAITVYTRIGAIKREEALKKDREEFKDSF